MPDLPIIIKRLDENEDPLPGAYLWDGPVASIDLNTGHISLHPFQFIEANSGDGQLFKDLGVARSDTEYVTASTWTELLSLGFPVVGEP